MRPGLLTAGLLRASLLFLVLYLAEHIELLIEVDINLAAVVQGDLNLIITFLVTHLGVRHAALAQVL
jgi:hypothetical protein